MQLRTYQDLNRDIVHGLWRIPRDIDVVVGIPRSGMLAASIVALSLNLPLADLEGYCSGRIMSSGSTRRPDRQRSGRTRALIVDDSSRTGNAMREARQRLAAAGLETNAVTCVVYGSPRTRNLVDIALVEIDKPRIFEWNVLHHPGLLAQSVLDIDGVLCHDPSKVENDDSERYLRFLQEAKPLLLPSHPVKALVTSRLEKYRSETESWLERHEVRYDRLVMLDVADAETRRRLGLHSVHKAKYYRDSDASLFIESEIKQARDIARLSGKPVYSMQGPQVVMPSAFSPRSAQGLLSNRSILSRFVRSRLGDSRVEAIRARLKNGFEGA